MKSKLEKNIIENLNKSFSELSPHGVRVTNKQLLKILRKQHHHNELIKYQKIVENYLEIGFDYQEAKVYARGLLRK